MNARQRAQAKYNAKLATTHKRVTIAIPNDEYNEIAARAKEVGHTVQEWFMWVASLQI